MDTSNNCLVSQSTVKSLRYFLPVLTVSVSLDLLLPQALIAILQHIHLLVHNPKMMRGEETNSLKLGCLILRFI